MKKILATKGFRFIGQSICKLLSKSINIYNRKLFNWLHLVNDVENIKRLVNSK